MNKSKSKKDAVAMPTGDYDVYSVDEPKEIHKFHTALTITAENAKVDMDVWNSMKKPYEEDDGLIHRIQKVAIMTRSGRIRFRCKRRLGLKVRRE